MPIYGERNIIASLHDFKTHISKYTRMLERGDYYCVEVNRYNKLIGVFITAKGQDVFKAREKERIEALLNKDDVKLATLNTERDHFPCKGQKAD